MSADALDPRRVDQVRTVVARLEALVAPLGGQVTDEGEDLRQGVASHRWTIHPPRAGLPTTEINAYPDSCAVAVNTPDAPYVEARYDADDDSPFEVNPNSQLTWIEAMVRAAVDGGWSYQRDYAADGALVATRTEIDADGWCVSLHRRYLSQVEVTHVEHHPIPGWSATI
ncbi:hypothetical protein [Streptoalloteichus hindustanus]|uniref:Uncharacterized protein n=1 Tax=Streptoalloteichus hindustanus TaxID=2017 RepID=A0A1M5EY84_STRHI|nr:hypothetical protein [Streptoalloteichus hindustanus]SHF83992.1 hypothetical protein SAMN05444320_105185 [Streptoalloteichus hindustanus]